MHLFFLQENLQRIYRQITKNYSHQNINMGSREIERHVILATSHLRLVRLPRSAFACSLIKSTPQISKNIASSPLARARGERYFTPHLHTFSLRSYHNTLENLRNLCVCKRSQKINSHINKCKNVKKPLLKWQKSILELKIHNFFTYLLTNHVTIYQKMPHFS